MLQQMQYSRCECHACTQARYAIYSGGLQNSLQSQALGQAQGVSGIGNSGQSLGDAKAKALGFGD